MADWSKFQTNDIKVGDRVRVKSWNDSKGRVIERSNKYVIVRMFPTMQYPDLCNRFAYNVDDLERYDP